jgi:hypothetical protein
MTGIQSFACCSVVVAAVYVVWLCFIVCGSYQLPKSFLSCFYQRLHYYEDVIPTHHVLSRYSFFVLTLSLSLCCCTSTDVTKVINNKENATGA